MSAHTPGPWFAEELSFPVHGGKWAIGYTGKTGRDKALAYAQSEPDAHLIAAAPDMLAALKRILSELEQEAEYPLPPAEPDPWLLAVQKMARDAIAKAEGER